MPTIFSRILIFLMGLYENWLSVHPSDKDRIATVEFVLKKIDSGLSNHSHSISNVTGLTDTLNNLKFLSIERIDTGGEVPTIHVPINGNTFIYTTLSENQELFVSSTNTSFKHAVVIHTAAVFNSSPIDPFNSIVTEMHFSNFPFYWSYNYGASKAANILVLPITS